VKNITIPICAEAYGTTVADWGFDNLVLVVFADGTKFLALWQGYEAARQSYEKNLSKLTNHAGTTSKRVNMLRAKLSAAGGDAKKPSVIFIPRNTSSKAKTISSAERNPNLKFLFVLKHEVTQDANPNVIPADIQEFAVQQVREAFQ
jgi:hypothetical protein